MTRIRIKRGAESGYWAYMDWGEKTRAEMVKMIRAQADRLRQEVAEIDATADDKFEVDIVLGPAVQKHVRSIP